MEYKIGDVVCAKYKNKDDVVIDELIKTSHP